MHLRLIFVVLALAVMEITRYSSAQTEDSQRNAAESTSEPTPDDISAMLAACVNRHELAGMAAVVMRNSRIMASGVAGVRRRGDTAPITINDRFHFGSPNEVDDGDSQRQVGCGQ
jgi:hypothetical protein